MTKIGLIADTHIPKAAPELPRGLLEGLRGVDMILHAGDMVDLQVLDALSGIAPVKAVWGNMDPREVRDELPEVEELEVGGFRIAMTHGSGAPFGIVKRVVGRLRGADCVVFGHTHAPLKEMRSGILVVNPGTPTDRRFATVNTYGILTVDEVMSAEIHYLESA